MCLDLQVILWFVVFVLRCDIIYKPSVGIVSTLIENMKMEYI